MDPYLAEFLGTTVLLLLGNGVVANVLLSKTKGHDAGLIVITAGWGMAVYVAVLCVGEFSGAHINPAVTIGLALAEKFKWALVPGYLAAQMLGGFLGAVLVYLFYKDHYDASEDADAKLGTFCNAPAIRSLPRNLFCETVATLILVGAVLLAVEPSFEMPRILSGQAGEKVEVGMGSLGALPVGLVVFAIGMCLGGTTGYAINPARDLAPRIAHAILPIAGKRDSDWSYSWVPVAGPLLGGAIAGLAFRLL